MRNLELWYARLDVARILSHAGDRVSRRERSAFKRRVAGARAKDHLRAMSKLTAARRRRLRIVSRPPLIVPVEELFPGDERRRRGGRCATMLRALPPQPARRAAPPARGLPLSAHGAPGRRGRERRDPDLDRPADRARRRRPAVPPGQAGRALGARARTPAGSRRAITGSASSRASGSCRSTATSSSAGSAPPGLDGTPRDYYVRQLWDWKARRGGRADVARPRLTRLRRRSARGPLRAPTRARATGRDRGLSRLGQRVRPRGRRLRGDLRGPERARLRGAGGRRARGPRSPPSAAYEPP